MSDHAGWWVYDFVMAPKWRFMIERFDGDSGFQRPQSERFIEKQTRQFDPRRFEPLICVKVVVDGTRGMIEDGDYVLSIIDGQHRFGMAERMAFEPIPALVHHDWLTYEERAMLFNELNLRRRQLSLRDSMRARQEGRDEDMLGLLALLHRDGFFLDGHRPEDANGHRPLFARGTLDRNYRFNASALDKALQAMRSWDDVITRRAQSIVIDALCVLARHEEFSTERMQNVFRDVGPQSLIREAREIAAQGQGNMTKHHVKLALLHHYNRGLRTRRIPLDG